jgi:carbon storage regulator CsrA
VLILSRKAGDSLMIDGGVRIVVLGVEGSSVRLGIDAPAEVRVMRGEILKQVERENELARISLASRGAEV